MTIYYIDSTVPDEGTGIGTDPDDPFKAWAEVPGTLNDNDVVRWKRGMSHTHPIGVAPWGGSYMVFEAYYNIDGSDDESISKPILTCSDPNENTFNIVNTTNRIGITIRNLDLRDATGATNRNLDIGTTNYTLISNILIENVDMSNAGLENLRLMGAGVTVRGCTLEGAGWDNMYTQGSYNIIENCTMTNPGEIEVTNGDNVQIGSTQYATPNNYIFRNNYLNCEGTVKANLGLEVGIIKYITIHV